MDVCTEQHSFLCRVPLPVNSWLANAQRFLLFNKTLDANIVSRSTVLQNALSNSHDDGAILVLPSGAGPGFFDAWAQLASTEATYKSIVGFSVPELLAGLKVRPYTMASSGRLLDGVFEQHAGTVTTCALRKLQCQVKSAQK